MPKVMHPDLADCLRRANPYVEKRVEISVPDVSKVLRRPDQWNPPAGFANGPRGGLELAATVATLAQFNGTQSHFDINVENEGRRVKGLAWTVATEFKSARIRSFSAKIRRVGIVLPEIDFELQIHRVTQTPGFKKSYNAGSQSYTSEGFTQYTFPGLLGPPIVKKAADITWVANEATLVFPLEQYGLILNNAPNPAPSADQTGELPYYIFSIRPLKLQPTLTGVFRWLTDTVASQDVAGIGTFKRVFWAADTDEAQWTPQDFSDTPNFKIDVEAYAASASVVYGLDTGAVPSAAAIGRIVLERKLPPGTDVTIEVSTTGSGGPFTVVKHGDLVASPGQQVYHIRLTLIAPADLRATPIVLAAGIEFRIPIDVSAEAILELPSRQADLPWGRASIADARLTVIRTGMRDYLDVATRLGSAYAATKLEADIFLASNHPTITRDKWLRLERMSVSNRTPSPTGETFTLMSYIAKLKRKIPLKTETINAVYTVAAGTTAIAIQVTPPLPTSSNTDYDGKHYFIRVRSTTVGTIPIGYTQEVGGNTGTNQLDLTAALPGTLLAGDIIELHSGVFTAPRISWQNADPADVWEEILFTHLGIPTERVGHGALPRGGYPPALADRAPGDTTTQNKLRVSNSISQATAADELIDQLDAIMGGVTIELDGQICWVQLYEHRAPNGTATLPLPPVSRVFDARDYTNLSTPPGLEKRATVVSAAYGVNHASVSPDSFTALAVQVVDSDALAWLTQQDLEDVGASEVPSSIAKWCYNTYDEGLYLATQLAESRVRATSTGLRVFPFTAVEAEPEALPGDTVIVITDQYTDYDPTTGRALAGPLAIRGTLVGVGADGRQLVMFVRGLAENVSQLTSSSGSAPVDPATSGLEISIEDMEGTESHQHYLARAGSLIGEFWGSYKIYPKPLPAPNDPLMETVWDEVKALAVPITLVDGSTELAIPKPPEGYVTLAQYNGIADDLAGTESEPVRIRIESPVSKAPKIENVVVRGTLVDLFGNEAVKSWGVFWPGIGNWENFSDGRNITVDVSKIGTNGIAGISGATSWELTIRAFVEPTEYVTELTLRDETRRIVATESAPAAAGIWDEFSVFPPAVEGSAQMSVKLKASSATGLTAKMWYRWRVGDGEFTPWTDISIDVGLSTPPTVTATYYYMTTEEREANTVPSVNRTTHEIRAELLDAGSTVIHTETKEASWYTPGEIV